MRDTRTPWTQRLGRTPGRVLRTLVRHGPEPVRRFAARVPYSRLSTLAFDLLRGRDRVTWRGCTLEVDPGELSGYYLYVLGDYEPTEIDTLVDLCRDARVFADVGSHTGLTALAVTRGCSQLQTFAFEPDANAAARFERNLVLNPDLVSRVHLQHTAMGEVIGRAGFTPSDDPKNTQVGRLASSTIGAAGPASVSVRVNRLDAFFADRALAPDVVKIDVEGAELQVLRGMSGLFEQDGPRAMVIEVHGFYFGESAGAFQEELATLLMNAGYHLRRLDNGTWRQAEDPPTWPGRCHLLCTRDGAAV